MLKQFLHFILFALFLNLQPVHAGHVGVMEITYHWVSGTTYQLNMVFYSNCVGVSPPSNANITVSSASLGLSSFTSISMLPTGGPGVPPLTPPNLFACSPTPNNPCYSEYVYRGNITVPSQARDWVISYELWCTGTNFVNVAANAQYAAAGLNNLDFPDAINQNWSPIWHNRRPHLPGHMSDTLMKFPVLSVCAGSNVLLDQSAKEYQGDVVRYEMIPVPTTGGASIGYIGGYSPLTYPLDVDTPPSLWIDSVQGQLFFKPINRPSAPNAVNMYLAAMKATEYRNDTNFSTIPPTISRKEIGWVIRNYMIVVTPSQLCPDSTMSFSNPTNPAVPSQNMTMNCGDSTFDISTTVPFLCSSADTNASFATLIDSTTNLPVTLSKAEVINCDQTNNGRKIRFTPAVTLSSNTSYYLVFKPGNDGNTLLGKCGSELPAYEDTLRLHFLSVGIGKLKGDAQGAGKFSDTLSGGCNQTKFIVNLSKKVLCSSVEPLGSDFSLASAVPPFTGFNISAASPIACSSTGETTQIEIMTSSALPDGIYNLNLTTGNDGNKLLNNCDDEWDPSSIRIWVQTPVVYLGADTTVCEGQPFSLSLNAGTGFLHYQWNTGANDTNQTLTVNIPGKYFVTAQTTYGCISSDTFNINLVKCGSSGLEVQNENSFSIFPNPANEVLFIRQNLREKYSIQIFDISGQLRFESYSPGNEMEEINLSGFLSGIYFIKIQNHSGRQYLQKITVK